MVYGILKGVQLLHCIDGDLMANNLLTLFKLDSDTIAFSSLVVSIVGAVAAIFAAFYANIAAFYAKKAATKRDLTPVEQNTQHVERFSNKILSIDTQIRPEERQEGSQFQAQPEPSQPQDEREISLAQQEAPQIQTLQEASQVQPQREASQSQREASQAQPQRIPITVEGEAMGEVPLELFLTLQESSVSIRRVERLGKAGKALGSSPCKATENALIFKSILAPEKVGHWWNAGDSASEGESRSVLRVHLQLDGSGREVYRDIPVSIVQGLRNVGIATLVVWTIKGSI
jgi:hypothetical protein